jgi:hypothetical protein
MAHSTPSNSSPITLFATGRPKQLIASLKLTLTITLTLMGRVIPTRRPILSPEGSIGRHILKRMCLTMAAQRKTHDSDKSMPEPRGWTREQAAYYCGVSLPTFDIHFAPHLTAPKVGRLRTKTVYDRHQIDAVWDRLSGLSPRPTAPGTLASDGATASDLEAQRLLAESYETMARRVQEAAQRKEKRRG